MMPDSAQHAVWYSLPNGWGLRGQNTHPGQVHRLNQMDMDPSKQIAHPALNFFCIFSFHADIISRTCQNLSRNDGGGFAVNRNADVMATYRRRDM